MTNPDMMTNMVKQGIGGFLPQVTHSLSDGVMSLLYADGKSLPTGKAWPNAPYEC